VFHEFWRKKEVKVICISVSNIFLYLISSKIPMFNWGQVRVSPQNGAQYKLVSSKVTFVKFKRHMSAKFLYFKRSCSFCKAHHSKGIT